MVYTTFSMFYFGFCLSLLSMTMIKTGSLLVTSDSGPHTQQPDIWICGDREVINLLSWSLVSCPGPRCLFLSSGSWALGNDERAWQKRQAVQKVSVWPLKNAISFLCYNSWFLSFFSARQTVLLMEYQLVQFPDICCKNFLQRTLVLYN